MRIDENTKVILRLHKKANNRALNIYNPFFEKSGINAIYLLRYNENPKKLVEGMRLLGVEGAIPAGFERDEEFVKLLDNLTPEAKAINRVAVVFNKDGKLVGHYQGGIGLYNSITSKFGSLGGKNIVILGAGAVARGLLLEIKKASIAPKIILINRTETKAELVKKEYSELNIQLAPFGSLFDQSGDVFVDATDIGSPWNKGDELSYTEKFVKGFKFIADVTFVPIEPQLIATANKLGVDNAPGHRMFLYQAEECMKSILGNQSYDLKMFEKIMLADFKTNWN